jgi:hypothetical protein
VEKFVNFDVESVELLEEENNSEFLTASIDAFSSGISRNNTFCDEESLKESAYTIYEKPIVFTIDSRHDDFYTHVPSDEVLNAGFIIPNSATFRKEGDRTILNVKAKIWARYSEKFVDIFRRDGNKKKVSVEAKLVDFAEDEQNGLIIMKKWIFSAVCVLGNLVESGIAGANMVLNFSKENEEYKKALAVEFGKYAEIDMSIPEKVKKNAEKGLSLSKEFGIGGTSVALANARFLARESSATADKVKHISKTHKSLKNKSFVKSPPNQEYVKFMLYGGKEAIGWTDEITSKMEEEDSKIMSYFEDKEIAFPYKSIKDAPPSIQKLNGVPLTASQASEIAAQADSIGGEYAWSTAIKSWKSRHEIKDGHWVVKEKTMDEEFAKEDMGKGKKLKVNKSKEKLSETPWGDVDKTSLQHSVLNASNYKTLVRSVYLLVEDGWEDHPGSSLKYPVMQLVGDTFVYNKSALSAALGRATQQNESGVVSKVKSIQSKLGLTESKKEEYSLKVKKTDEIKKAELKFSLTSSQITEILNNALSEFVYGENDWSKYWVYSFDEEYAYVRDSQDGKSYRMKYSIENLVATIDTEGKEEVIQGNPIPVQEESYTPEFEENFEEEKPEDKKDDDKKPEGKDEKIEPKEEEKQEDKEGFEKTPESEEEKAEDKKEEDKEPKEVEMSNDMNLDIGAMLSMLDNQTEEYRKLVEKHNAGETDFAGLCKMAYEKLCKMAEDAKKAEEDKDAFMAVMAENESLKKFKEDVEKSRFDYAVESTINEVLETMPKDKIDEIREDSKNFTLETIDGWKNKVKAMAFEYSKDKTKPNDGITRIDMSGWMTEKETNKDYSKGWL